MLAREKLERSEVITGLQGRYESLREINLEQSPSRKGSEAGEGQTICERRAQV